MLAGSPGRPCGVLPLRVPAHGALSVPPEVLVCVYGLERFGSEVLMDNLRTHPRVMVDGVIHDNLCYVEPGKFVAARG